MTGNPQDRHAHEDDGDEGHRTTEDGARTRNMPPGAAEQTRRAQERGPVEPAHPAAPHSPRTPT